MSDSSVVGSVMEDDTRIGSCIDTTDTLADALEGKIESPYQRKYKESHQKRALYILDYTYLDDLLSGEGDHTLNYTYKKNTKSPGGVYQVVCTPNKVVPCKDGKKKNNALSINLVLPSGVPVINPPVVKEIPTVGLALTDRLVDENSALKLVEVLNFFLEKMEARITLDLGNKYEISKSSPVYQGFLNTNIPKPIMRKSSINIEALGAERAAHLIVKFQYVWVSVKDDRRQISYGLNLELQPYNLYPLPYSREFPYPLKEIVVEDPVTSSKKRRLEFVD